MLSQALKPETKQRHPVIAFVLDALWYVWWALLVYWMFDASQNWGHQSEFMTAFGIYAGMGFFAAIILMAWIFVAFRKKGESNV